MNRTGQQGAHAEFRGRAGHQVCLATLGNVAFLPSASPLAMRLASADNGSRDNSPGGRAASRRLVGLAPAVSGAGQACGQLRQAVRLMRRTGRACRDVKILLGVYVLGGLRGSQESGVRTHLTGCARGRAEDEELAEVPALLDMLTGEEAAGAGKLPGLAGGSGESAEEPATRADAPEDGAELPSPLPFRRAPPVAEPG